MLELRLYGSERKLEHAQAWDGPDAPTGCHAYNIFWCLLEAKNICRLSALRCVCEETSTEYYRNKHRSERSCEWTMCLGSWPGPQAKSSPPVHVPIAQNADTRAPLPVCSHCHFIVYVRPDTHFLEHVRGGIITLDMATTCMVVRW